MDGTPGLRPHPDSDEARIGKSTFLRDYCLWRVAKDPTIRIAYASASADFAKRQVSTIRNVIEGSVKLAEYTGPLKPSPDQRGYTWGADAFMVAARQFTVGEDEADPTMKAYGLGGQIEGARADLFIVDDPDGRRFTDSEREKIWENLLTVVESRLTVGAKLVILSNRWDTHDIAGRLIAQEAEMPGLWRVHTSPAILRERRCVEGHDVCAEHEADPNDWGEVLWPEKFGSASTKVGDKWTPERASQRVARTRDSLAAAGKLSLFYLVYQNDPLGDIERDFTEEMVDAALERGRGCSFGSVPPNCVVVCAQDPAVVEGAATIAIALLNDGTRLVVDCVWGKKRRTEGLHEWLREFGRFKPSYWGIEAQGPWKAYADSPEVKKIVWDQGANLSQLPTGEDKRRADIGVSSLLSIVATKLAIPSATPQDRERMEDLIRQLRNYRAPEKVGSRYIGSGEPDDCVLALWFAERVIREKQLDEQTFRDHPKAKFAGFQSPYMASWEFKVPWER
jgi:hypothetical protein